MPFKVRRSVEIGVSLGKKAAPDGYGQIPIHTYIKQMPEMKDDVTPDACKYVIEANYVRWRQTEWDDLHVFSDVLWLRDNLRDEYAVVAGLNETQKAAMYKDVVCPAFAKFDKDGSNAIDRDELAALMKSLGTELTDDQVTTALKDLDINKDGVIDLSEFSRWFFTGMQSYGGVSRTLLRLKKGTGAGGVLKSLKDQFKDCLSGEDVKMKEHSVEVSFNEPANPGTVVELKISPHGPALKENYARLSDQYKDLHAHITAEHKKL